MSKSKNPEPTMPHMGGKSFFAINWEDFSYLEGKLLTYIDATYSDREQREAHKSIVKQIVRQFVQDRHGPYFDWEIDSEGKVTFTNTGYAQMSGSLG